MSGRLTAAALVLAAVPSLGRADPALDWMLNCRGCHGADGAGVGDAVPRLAGEVARFLAVPGGREYLVRVPGVAQSELPDERLAALLTWLVRRFGPAPAAAAAPPFTAAEVRRWRRAPLVDVAGARRALVARFEPIAATAPVRTDGAGGSAARAPRRR